MMIHQLSPSINRTGFCLVRTGFFVEQKQQRPDSRKAETKGNRGFTHKQRLDLNNLEQQTTTHPGLHCATCNPLALTDKRLASKIASMLRVDHPKPWFLPGLRALWEEHSSIFFRSVSSRAAKNEMNHDP